MKKFFCYFLVVCILAGSGASVMARTDLAREQIPIANNTALALNRLGIMLGTENGFELERSVTRAEALTLIGRTTQPIFYLPCLPYEDNGPIFEDIKDHWAYDTIETFYRAGYINGISQTHFAPDRTITGREFAKILLSVLGYTDVTIENAYDIGLKSELLLNNFTATIIYNDWQLTRGDAARLCFAALCAKTSGGEMLYKTLISRGLYEKDAFDGILYSACGEGSIEMSFDDKMNELMPGDKNYMFSPLSIKMALALAANGAQGETKQQIIDACGIQSLDEFNLAAQKMIEKYSKTDALRLDIANSVWINQSRSQMEFSNTYKEKIAQFYGAKADVVTDDDAQQKINGWVKEKTNGKIPSIINNSDFWAYLVNAVYFKASWKDDFMIGATKKSEFTDRNGQVSEIDFMNDTKWLDYYESDDKSVRIAKLDYKNFVEAFDENGEWAGVKRYDDIDVSMYFVLSENKNAAVARSVRDAKLERTYVKLSVPKFKIEFSTSLNDMLKSLGIKRAFNESEFEPMFKAGNMWITDTVHKTYISVDEHGTEAAAVTGMGMAGSALPPKPIEFILDRPFSFIIRDNISDEILFMGEYAFVD
ncbi:MAG: hypothetical protein E7410_05895 [Ruminococcaceae bacterium]|nr:hypothetical protein [Oscillospiraceae bacterium]